MTLIELETRDGGVGVITFNRPDKRNAFNVQMRAELTELLRGRAVRELTCVILKGSGKSFSAGADLREVSDPSTWPGPAPVSQMLRAIRDADPVVIAAVHGAALGLGSGVAMASDMVIAGRTAIFGYPEAQHGLVASLTAVGLKQLVSRRAAMELLVTGRTVGADEALALGMVNEVVDDGALMVRAAEIAAGIAVNSTFAVKATKRLFSELDELGHAAAMEHAERVVGDIRRSADARQRSAAFFERSGNRVVHE